MLKEALDKYIKAHGKYPVLTGDIGELRHALVDGGYLTDIPNDPLEGRRYRYSSNELGTAYALLFKLEVPSGKIASDGLCLSWPNPGRGETFFGNPPDCPF